MPTYYKSIRFMLVLLTTGTLFPGLVSNATAKDEPIADILISADTTLSGDLVVPANQICLIKPGLRIGFDGYARIAVYGLLIAEGTAVQPIIFAGKKQVTGSYQKTTWKGIEIIGSGAQARLRHCKISGAYRNLVWEASPSFDSCEFTGNHFALYCANQAKPPVKNCRFFSNVYGIVSDMAAPLLLNNTITGNSVGLHLKLSSESIVGKNSITGNKKNIFTEQLLGEDKSSLSIHNLWNIVNQLY